ncbi:MAG: BatA domain-containing protein [Phycisphaerales bacterium]|nr:BatA domain-containing protein [Phycisphaerales bacterium]
MTFVSTWLAFAGLVAISVPILIHLLFRRRRQPVEWGAMRLLMEAIRRHRRRARIEQILLLVIRCLIILLVGLALAEPIISSIRSIGVGSRLVVFVIDDGLVSGIQDSNGSPELDASLDQARRVVGRLNPGDRVALVTTSHPPRVLTDGPTPNLDMVDRILDDIDPGSSRSDLGGALDLANRLVRDHGAGAPTTVALLGSWREGSFTTLSGEDARGSIASVNWPEESSIQLLAGSPTEEPATVLAISGMSMRRPVDSTQVDNPPVRTTIRLQRVGGDLGAGESVVSMEGPGIEDSTPRQIEWYPGRSEAVIEFSGRADSTNAAIDGTSVITALVDGVTLPTLSRRSMLVDTSRSIQVTIVDRQSFGTTTDIDRARSSDWIERALEPGSQGVIEVDRLDPSSLSTTMLRGVDALILARPDLLPAPAWSLVREFVDLGGFLLVVPPTDLEVHPWLDDMSREFDITWDVEIGVAAPEEPVDLAVEQPGGSYLAMLDTELDALTSPVEVFRHLRIKPGPGDGRTLIKGSDDSPILIAWEPGEGRRGALALLTTAPHLDWTTLPVKPLMVPLMQELIREGTTSGRVSMEVLAGEKARTTMTGVREFSGPGGIQVSVDQAGLSTEPLRRTGHWVARDSEGAALSMVVVNPEIAAGDPSLVSAEEFKARLGVDTPWNLLDTEEMAARFSEDRDGRFWSLLLLAIVLLLVVTETALNRWFARSRVNETSLRGDIGNVGVGS